MAAHLTRALKHRNYRLFFSGQTVSLVGTWITRIATSWLVYRLTHSVFLLGVVGFFALAGRFHAAPLALAGATAGTFVACVPAALLGERFAATLPVRAIRYAVAALFLLVGFIVGVNALQLT